MQLYLWHEKTPLLMLISQQSFVR